MQWHGVWHGVCPPHPTIDDGLTRFTIDSHAKCNRNPTYVFFSRLLGDKWTSCDVPIVERSGWQLTYWMIPYLYHHWVYLCNHGVYLGHAAKCNPGLDLSRPCFSNNFVSYRPVCFFYLVSYLYFKMLILIKNKPTFVIVIKIPHKIRRLFVTNSTSINNTIQAFSI